MLIIRGVNVYPSQVEAVLVAFPGIGQAGFCRISLRC
jgi:acyl-CoA synthetase (AMP-forming)/AMP-acid ligase II